MGGITVSKTAHVRSHWEWRRLAAFAKRGYVGNAHPRQEDTYGLAGGGETPPLPSMGNVGNDTYGLAGGGGTPPLPERFAPKVFWGHMPEACPYRPGG